MDAEVKRNFDDVFRGRSFTPSQFNLAASPATSTTVSRPGVSSGSVVVLVPHSNAAMSDIVRVIPAKDAFTVTHTSSTTTRTFRYVYMTGNL